MQKSYDKGFIKFLLKKFMKLLPSGAPARIYKGASMLPFFKKIINALIKSIIPKSITIDEGVVLLNQKDVAVSGALAMGMFEKKELDIFRRSIRVGDTVIDIGANIGLYTIIAAKKVGSSGKVFSFEPEQENFSLLKDNVAKNSFKNTVMVNSALSDTSGQRELYLSEDNKGHYSFSDDSISNKKILVQTETLDNFMKRQGSFKVDVIKMDVEGAEPLVFEGMKETVTRNPEIVIFTEIYPNAIRRLGKDPLKFLISLNNLGLPIWIIDESKVPLEKLSRENFESFIESFSKGESFKNLYVGKGL